MMKIDKDALAQALRAQLAGSFVNFLEKPDMPTRCAVCVTEELEDSAWAGACTERIRRIVREMTPAATCVCVKPLQFGGYVWYRIEVAGGEDL